MTIYDIPTPDAVEGPFSITVELDGSSYQFNFIYNDREDYWYFDLLDVEGNHVRSGVKVVVNYPLIRLAMSSDRPPGELLVIDGREAATDPQMADLGIDALLNYVPKSEVEAL